jgi:AraC family transcriptional regulator, regulatory protein of adaptative response / DNA-3-methyladenine glycosylase II
VRLALEHRRPFHGAGLLAFLAARAVPGVEEVTADGRYRRSLRLAHGPGVVELDLRRVTGALLAGDPRDAAEAERRCRALLDLDVDPVAVDATLVSDPWMRDLVAAAPGIRVPGHVDPVELAVRAVLGQQVSVPAAVTLAARLVAAHGEPLPEPAGGVTRLFPSAEAIDAAVLAMPRARAEALKRLARAVGDGLELRDRDRLLALGGIGPWTADYLALRSGDRDVLLATDLGVRRALSRLPGADPERWRPYRSYAVMHLWSAGSRGPRAK